MIDSIKRNVRQSVIAIRAMQARGYTLSGALLFHFPAAASARAYGAFARRMNRTSLLKAFNYRRLQRFHRASASPVERTFCVIVMPWTLHYLLPCLSLLPPGLRVYLIANGARCWERRVLEQRFPRFPLFKLATLPLSSLSHGDVITALLDNVDVNFGLIDHDCYVFDGSIFERLTLQPGDALMAVFGGIGRKARIPYPETFFLFLNSEALRKIMRRYGIDARIYRRLPAAARARIDSMGLGSGVYLKDNHDYFDTLHALLVLALSEGFRFDFLQSVAPGSFVHIGSTSSGVPQTKDLFNCYVQWRFLELADQRICMTVMPRVCARFGVPPMCEAGSRARRTGLPGCRSWTRSSVDCRGGSRSRVRARSTSPSRGKMWRATALASDTRPGG